MDEPSTRYDNVSIALHWITAALVIALWLIAQLIDLFPRGAPRTGARSVHVVLGVALSAVFIARLLWRLAAGRRLAPLGPEWMARSATLAHRLLNALLAFTLLAGLLNGWVRGDSIFGLFRIPELSPGNRWLRGVVGETHELAANTVLLLAGLHAAASLFHHLFLRDATLRRMLPAPRS